MQQFLQRHVATMIAYGTEFIHLLKYQRLHISAVVRNRKILSIAINTFCGMRSYHAEVNAIKKYLAEYGCRDNVMRLGIGKRHIRINNHRVSVRRKLKKCTVIVIRINYDGQLMMSMPCACCATYLRQIGIKSVHYRTDCGAINTMRNSEIYSTHLTGADVGRIDA